MTTICYACFAFFETEPEFRLHVRLVHETEEYEEWRAVIWGECVKCGERWETEDGFTVMVCPKCGRETVLRHIGAPSGKRPEELAFGDRAGNQEDK